MLTSASRSAAHHMAAVRLSADDADVRHERLHAAFADRRAAEIRRRDEVEADTLAQMLRRSEENVRSCTEEAERLNVGLDACERLLVMEQHAHEATTTELHRVRAALAITQQQLDLSRASVRADLHTMEAAHARALERTEHAVWAMASVAIVASARGDARKLQHAFEWWREHHHAATTADRGSTASTSASTGPVIRLPSPYDALLD